MRFSVSNCASSRRQAFLGALVLSLVVLLASVSAFSQGNAGRILGAVTDQTGGTIAGATVTILDTARGTARTLTTDDSGEYNAPNLIPGTYTVRAETKGFKTAERQSIILEVSQELRVDLTLQPGEQTERITVTEALPMVETTNAVLGGTLQNQIIDALPLNGRNFENLIQLRPGTTMYPGGGPWAQSTNGMRAKDNVYMVDGVNSSDPWMGQSVMNAVMAAGDAGTILPIDAIDEFKSEQNPRAEYGWKPGAVVNVGIKSGTNSHHGTAYAYGRDGSWDANNFFVNATSATAPPVELEQFGGTFGGPIKKDKLFFFTNFENQRYTVGSNGTLTVPITAAGAGTATNNLMSACSGVAPASRSALSLQLAGLSSTCTPLANYPGLFAVNSGANSTSIADTLQNQNRIYSGLAKVDYRLTDKHSINALYFISPGNGVLNDAPNAQTNPVWMSNLYARSQAFSSNWTWVPSSSLVNEARVGYSHYYQSFLSVDHTQNPASYNFNGTTYNFYTGQANPLYFGFPQLTFTGFTGTLGASWPKVVGPDGVLQILDHVSVLRGRHAFKFGGEILNERSTTNVTANTKGPLTFDSLASFFGGTPGPGGSASLLVGNLVRNFSYGGYSAFLQDDWRVKPRLTVNLGLRYELSTVPKERNGLQGSFDPVRGLVQNSTPYNGDHNNFSPRLGFAWDIFGNGRTVLRGGGGILYEQLTLDAFQGIGNSFGLRTTPTGALVCTGGVSCVPGSGNIAVVNVSYSGTSLTGSNPGNIAYDWQNNSSSVPLYNFTATCGDGNTAIPGPSGFKPPPCNAMFVDQNLRTPYVESWNIGIQRAITNTLSLDLGYVGNHGVKLIGVINANQAGVTNVTVPAGTVVPGLGPIAAPITITTGPGWTPISGGSNLLTNCLQKLTSGACNATGASSVAAVANARPYSPQFPYLRYIDQFGNFDTSNYNALQATLTARNYHGLSLTTGYTYSHALGEASDQGTSGGLVVPPNSYGNFRQQLYTSTAFDMRHRFTLSGTYNLPGAKGFGQMLQGWALNFTSIIQTGTPWGVNDNRTDFVGTGETIRNGNPQASMGAQWNFIGNPSDFKAIHNFTSVNPLGNGSANGSLGIPYYPGLGNAATPTNNPACNSAAAGNVLAQASLAVLGCYALGNSVLVPPAYGSYGTMPRNPWRDQGFRNLDLSLTKLFSFRERWKIQLRGELFNVLNRANFTNPFGGPAGNAANLNPTTAGPGGAPVKGVPGVGFGAVQNTPDQASSNPVLGSGGARAIQVGLKLIF